MNTRRIGVVVAVTVLIAGAFTAVQQVVDERSVVPEVSTFRSEQQFREYISEHSGGTGYDAGDTALREFQAAAPTGDKTEVERYSRTNVQEKGIQEPDILKTGGRRFYYSPPEHPYIGIPEPQLRSETSIYYPDRTERNTSVIRALPPENITKKHEIPEDGKMLLHGEVLTVFTETGAVGYDVSGEPAKKWEIGFNGTVVDARLESGKIYAVLRQEVDRDDPCPLRPMTGKTVPCTSIYYPGDITGADSTYTVVSFNATTGRTGSATSFVGSSRSTEVYVSSNAVYITYMDSMSRLERLQRFLSSARGLLDQETREEINRLQEYDISREAKLVELQNIIREYRTSLPDEEEGKFSRRFSERYSEWSSGHKRQLTRTGIVRVETDGELSVDARGEVPGRMLDQFSMDEHEGYLRVATTVGDTRTESGNDLYVLDAATLERRGAVQGMGVNERIYSTRFIGDQAYVVTFRRIDPFHIIDLSDPEDPEVTGKLKLPGFSSYLHPLGGDRILGIGMENGSTKAVVFNVSDPQNPEVADSTTVEGFGSEVGENHHAFTIDRKHGVFFLPSGNTGYIFSYREGLEKLREVKLRDPVRARYINDHMYLFGSQKVKVLNETTWRTVDELDLHQ
ncbi:MAG: beta-propeller domain-containing protein [Candidatus Nanohaloarchaea archaeon]